MRYLCAFCVVEPTCRTERAWRCRRMSSSRHRTGILERSIYIMSPCSERKVELKLKEGRSDKSVWKKEDVNEQLFQPTDGVSQAQAQHTHHTPTQQPPSSSSTTAPNSTTTPSTTAPSATTPSTTTRAVSAYEWCDDWVAALTTLDTTTAVWCVTRVAGRRLHSFAVVNCT